MGGCSAFQVAPFHVHVPCGVTATISCCAGSPAKPHGLTCGPLLNVLGLDHAEPVHVVMLPEQQVTRPGEGIPVGMGTGMPLDGDAGCGVASVVDGWAILAPPDEAEAPDDPSTSGHGTAIAGDAGPPQA